MVILRQEFVDSQFMRIELTSYEKKWVHHNRYHLQITLDKQNIKIKKKYSELKRFSQEVVFVVKKIQKNLGVKNIALEQVMRSSQQYRNIQILIKRLNAEFLDIKSDFTEKQKSFRRDIRNYLYNMLFYNDEMNQSDDDQVEQKPQKNLQDSPSPLPKSSSTTNELKVDKGIKNKSMALAASLVSTVLKKTEVEPLKQIFKNINIIWLKRCDDQWHECRLNTSETSLILHDRYENVKIVIILCKMNVYCVEEPYQRIVLTHKLLKENFELRLTNIGIEVKIQDDPILSDKYLAFDSILKSLCHKQRMIETYNFIKIKLSFGKGSLAKGSNLTAITASSGSAISGNLDKKGKEIAFKLTHNSITTAFTIFPQHKCEILVPITSNFGVLQFFSTQVKQNGVVPSFKQNLQTFIIPVQNIYDALYNQKPKRKTQIHTINLQTKSSNYSLHIDYQESGTYETLYACDTENDKFEGNMQFDQPNRDEVRIQFNRLKRIAWTIEQYIVVAKDLEHFANPLASYLYYALLVFVIVSSDMNYLLHYTIGLLVLIMLYNHPSFNQYLKEVIGYFNFVVQFYILKSKLTDKSKNTFLGEHFDSKQNFQVSFKIDLEKKHFVDQFQLRMRKKRNIYKKYKRLQQILVKLQNAIMQLVNYIEKIKNIFTWYHHKKSKIVYLGMIGVLFVIVFIPIRFILLIFVYKKFKKGKKYFANTKEYNESVINQIFFLTLREYKIDDFSQYLMNDTKVLNKKDPDYQTFEKKVKENLQTYLGIEFNQRVFDIAKNIKELKIMLSLCKKRYKIPMMICRKYELNQMFAIKESFIAVIPSDRNILGVKAQKDGEGDQKLGDIEEGKEEVDAIDI